MSERLTFDGSQSPANPPAELGKPDAAHSSSQAGADDSVTALARLTELGEKEDGTGRIEAELVAFLDSLGEVAFADPDIRIAGQVLLGKVLTGLGEDEQVANMLVRNIQDSLGQPPARGQDVEQTASRSNMASSQRAAEVVAIRLLRVMVRMEALELHELVVQQRETEGLSPSLRLALELTADLLAAEALDAHPDEIVRVFVQYADRIMLNADSELVDYFNALDSWVHVRKRDLRMGQSGARADGA